MKVGLYFGTFNPIHNGHLMLANYFVENTDLDQLWFVVSPQNPFKQKNTLLNDYQRLELVNLAIEGYHKFRASNVEFSLPKPSYTVNTLAYLKEKYPNYQFIIIMGEDNLERFTNWKNYQTIIDNYQIYVFERKGCPKSDLIDNKKIIKIESPLLEVSSTFVRNSIKEGKDVRFFMPEKVAKYVDENNLYR